MTSFAERIIQLLAAKPGGKIGANRVLEIFGDTPVEEAMLDLTEIAAHFSQPAISGYRVGAVGLGKSGALYFGANLEFPELPLWQSVHAEQCLVALAAAARETGLVRLALGAAPCGHCRQFLHELVNAESLEICRPGCASEALSSLLPSAFGPGDLDVEGGLLSLQNHGLEIPADSVLERAAGAAANASYAPYSGAPGGAAIAFKDEAIFAGSYLENAAFNPSLPPLQSALVQAMMAGRAFDGIREVVIVQKNGSVVNHSAFVRELLDRIAPTAKLRVVFAT